MVILVHSAPLLKLPKKGERAGDHCRIKPPVFGWRPSQLVLTLPRVEAAGVGVARVEGCRCCNYRHWPDRVETPALKSPVLRSAVTIARVVARIEQPTSFRSRC